MKKFYSIFKNIWNVKLKGRLIAAVVSAVALLIINYLYGHIPLPLSSNEYVALKNAEQRMERWGMTPYYVQNDSSWRKSALLINTSFDFDTIPHYEYTDQNTRFTDNEGYGIKSNRIDLYRVLKAYSQDTSLYTYIIFDVALDSLPYGHSPHVDSLVMYTDSIIDLIATMPRICVAKSSTFEFASKKLEAKAGSVDYMASQFVSDFLKYELLQDSAMSLPLRMYRDLTGRTIKKCMWGAFYMDGCYLCRKNIIPAFSVRYKTFDSGWEIDSHGRKHYECQDGHYNLHFFVKNYTGENQHALKELGRRIVVIGNLFTQDIHTTYAGKMSGVMINLNTYINLAQRKHIIRAWEILCLFVFYVGMFFFVLYCEKWWYKIPFWQRFWQADITQLVISFFSWLIVFRLIAGVIYITFGVVYNIWIPILWFTMISKIYKYIISPKYEN